MYNPEIEYSGVFIDYKDPDYFRRMKDTIERENFFSASQLTPRILEQSPYKLHISISSNDYLSHHTEITNILLRHMENGVIKEFKHVDIDKVNELLDRYSQLKTMFITYQKHLKNNTPLDDEWTNIFLASINSTLGFGFHGYGLPAPENIPAYTDKLNLKTDSLKRFSEGDQVTIYIPEDYQEESILNLCADITTFLSDENVSAGVRTDVESTLGKYLNLRQEYLLQDYETVNNKGEHDASLRIQAVQDIFDENAQQRRVDVKIEQENSSLFNHLSDALLQTSGPSI